MFVGHQVIAEPHDEIVIAVLLVAGESRHHQFALQAGDVEGRHIGGLGAGLRTGKSGSQEAGGEQTGKQHAHGIAPVL